MLAQYKIAKPDPALAASTKARIDNKTKPPGSLGAIETLALQLALAQNRPDPVADPARLLLFAADHGLVAEGVSAWPQEVTTQMVLNFLAGGAAANVFARLNNCAITIVDAGIAGELPDHAGLVRANIRKGTRNARHQDALDATEVEVALEFGAALSVKAANNGDRILALGEMGIGNTSSAALICHAIEGIDLAILTGPGAGLDGAGVTHKRTVLEQTAARRPGRLEPIDALAAFGGLEITMMAGAIIGAGSKRTVVMVDGFIATAAALAAIRARPEIASNCVFAHRSHEPGHRLVLEALGVRPLLDLDMRLGEGSGALLALPLARAAAAMLRDMATFESANVSDKSSR